MGDLIAMPRRSGEAKFVAATTVLLQYLADRLDEFASFSRYTEMPLGSAAAEGVRALRTQADYLESPADVPAALEHLLADLDGTAEDLMTILQIAVRAAAMLQ